jgi:RNA polymerase sigma-70 factor (ECF subfamily)
MADMALSDVNEDLDLLRRMRAGDREAMARLYARHQGPLYRFALLRAGAPDVAADVVQDVFIALIEGRLAFDPARGALASFLYGVTRNFLLKRDEAERRFVSTSRDDDDDDLHEPMAAAGTADVAPSPEDMLLKNRQAETVRAALAHIKPHYRDVLILYELQDLSYVEIAHICGIDIGTVRSRLNRARGKLAALLGITNTAAPTDSAERAHAARPNSH